MITITTSHSPASALFIHPLLLAKRRDLPVALCSACTASIARECCAAKVPRPNARMHITRKQWYGGSGDAAGSPARPAADQVRGGQVGAPGRERPLPRPRTSPL